MRKIKHLLALVIILSIINQINLFPFMYIASPSSVNVLFPEGSKTRNSGIKWEEIKEAKLSIDEDTRVRQLQKLSYLNWTVMKEKDLALLKAFVEEARKSFPKFLTDQTIKDALLDPNGVLELVRRSHPYTLQVLHNPDLFTHHSRRHEGMYYRLFALKLLGRKSQGPVVVLNVDPHRDYMGGSDSRDEYIRKDGYGIHVVHGITDLNWGAAIVRDGLADEVINAYGFPEKPFLKWFFINVYKNKSGDVVSDVPAYLIPNEFHALVDKVQQDFPACQLHWTVDLDSFGPCPKDGLREHIFFQPEAIPEQLTHLLKGLEGLHPHAVSLTTADSRGYLAPEADEAWIANARQAVKNTFENTLFENDEFCLFGGGRPAREGKNANNDISAKKVFSQIVQLESLILAAEMIDETVRKGDTALLVGVGSRWAHPVACAIRKAHADIVQPDIFLFNDQHAALIQHILKINAQIQESYKKDLIEDRIDTETYRDFIENVDLPSRYYSQIFLLEILDYIAPGGEILISQILAAAKNNAQIFISARNGDFQAEWDIDFLKSCAKKIGYKVNNDRLFDGGGETIFTLRVQLPEKEKINIEPADNFPNATTKEIPRSL